MKKIVLINGGHFEIQMAAEDVVEKNGTKDF